MLSNILKFGTKIKSAATKFLYRARFFGYASVLATALFTPFAAHASITGIAAMIAAFLVFKDAAISFAVWVFVIYLVVHMIWGLAFGLFLFFVNMLIGVSQYNSFLGAPIVTIGWAVTRDIANMFLVVALLVIAFGVIFDSHHYQAQKMLGDFFIAAILVNFSKMICGLMLDAAQVVMMTFVSGFSGTAAGNFVKMFQIGSFLHLASANLNAPDVSNLSTIASDWFSSITSELFSFVLIIFAIVAVVSMLAVLIGRILTLWFLIIASPLAFVLKVLPMTKKFSDKWWHAFEKELLAGPIVAFVIWVSLASIAVSADSFNLTKQAQQQGALFNETSNATASLTSTSATASQDQTVASSEISKWSNLALYFTPIILFILGAQWAVKLSGGLSQSINAMTGKVADKYARKGLAAVGRDAGRVFTGQGSAVLKGTNFVGQKAGSLLESGGKRLGSGPGFMGAIGGALQYTGKATQMGSDRVAGDRAGALARSRIKDVKKVGTFLGLTKESEENDKIKRADADAALIESKAEKEYQSAAREHKRDYDRAATLANPADAERMRLAADTRLVASEEARTVANNKAKEMRGAVSADAKKKMLARGIGTPGLALKDLQDRTANGDTISQIDLDNYMAIVKDAERAEIDKKIQEEKDAGVIMTPEKEAQLRGEITARNKGTMGAITTAINEHKSRRMPSEAEAQKAFRTGVKSETTMSPKVFAAMQRADIAFKKVKETGKTVANMIADGDANAIALTIGGQMANISHANPAQEQALRDQALDQALRQVPEALRPSVITQLQAEAANPFKVVNEAGGAVMDDGEQQVGTPEVGNPGDPGYVPASADYRKGRKPSQKTSRVVVNIPVGINMVTGASTDTPTYLGDVNTAQRARPKRTADPMSEKVTAADLKMYRNAQGQDTFSDPTNKANKDGARNARALETGIRQDATFVARLHQDAIANPEVQQIIGKSITTVAQLDDIHNELTREGSPYTASQVESIMRTVKDAVILHSEDKGIADRVRVSMVVDPPRVTMSRTQAAGERLADVAKSIHDLKPPSIT